MKAFALYDALILFPLAIYPTFPIVDSNLQLINTVLGGSGWPIFLPFHALFVALLGVVGLTWAVARFLQPSLLFARLDGIARLVVALVLYAPASSSGVPILYLYIASELVIGVFLLSLKVSRN